MQLKYVYNNNSTNISTQRFTYFLKVQLSHMNRLFVCFLSSKGPFIFYERGGGGGLVGFWGGGHAKKTAFEGGAIPKKLGKKGGPREIF